MSTDSLPASQQVGSLGRAFVHGALAYVAGFLAVALLVGGRVGAALESTTVSVGGDPVTLAGALAVAPNLTPGWKLVGWLFYGAHLVPIEFYQLPLQFGGGFLAVLLVPPLALSLAGAYHATTGEGGRAPAPEADRETTADRRTAGDREMTADRETTADPGTTWDDGIEGASIVYGYLPLTVVGGILVQVDPGAALLGTGPSMVFVVVFGTLYPLVFGGAGAVAVHGRRRGRRSEAAEEATE